MKLYLFVVLALLLASPLINAITLVPGNMTIEILNPDSREFCEGDDVEYRVLFEGVPLNDTSNNNLGRTFFEIEIRGSRPGGGPRGFIAIALESRPLSQFATPQRHPGRPSRGLGVFQIPEGYDGYVYFLRPNLVFELELGTSSNFRNAAATPTFRVSNCSNPA